jgi:hypothetical protein
VSEQRVRRGQVCDGGRHEVKKSRDIGLNPLLNLDYLSSFKVLRNRLAQRFVKDLRLGPVLEDFRVYAWNAAFRADVMNHAADLSMRYSGMCPGPDLAALGAVRDAAAATAQLEQVGVQKCLHAVWQSAALSFTGILNGIQSLSPEGVKMWKRVNGQGLVGHLSFRPPEQILDQGPCNPVQRPYNNPVSAFFNAFVTSDLLLHMR